MGNSYAAATGVLNIEKQFLISLHYPIIMRRRMNLVFVAITVFYVTIGRQNINTNTHTQRTLKSCQMRVVCFIWIWRLLSCCSRINLLLLQLRTMPAQRTNTTGCSIVRIEHKQWLIATVIQGVDASRLLRTNADFFSFACFLLCLFSSRWMLFLVLQSPHIQSHQIKWNRMRRVHRATDKLYAKKQHITLAHSSNSMLWLELLWLATLVSAERFIRKSKKKSATTVCLMVFASVANFHKFQSLFDWVWLNVLVETVSQCLVHNYFGSMTTELLEFAFLSQFVLFDLFVSSQHTIWAIISFKSIFNLLFCSNAYFTHVFLRKLQTFSSFFVVFVFCFEFQRSTVKDCCCTTRKTVFFLDKNNTKHSFQFFPLFSKL